MTDENTRVKCDNCGFIGTLDQWKSGQFPSGSRQFKEYGGCPKCGSKAYSIY